MEKILYHGSDHIIERPKYGTGKPYNDYGLGFYCTENPNMAKEWGVGSDRDGYANQYQLDCDGLFILDLNDPQYTMLHWLTIRRQMLSSAIVPMTAIFLLLPILSTVPFLTASSATPCAWANWGSRWF